MMNFREELNKIKKEGPQRRTGIQKIMTNILNQILEYFSERQQNGFPESTEILFSKDSHNRVYGRVYIDNDLDRDANFITDVCCSKEEAMMVLVFLEQKFKDEGFELLPETSVSRDGCFSVIIKI